MNYVSVMYSGNKIDAENYFEDVFAEKHCNTNILSEALKSDVSDALDDESTKDLKNEVSELEVAAKLRSA